MATAITDATATTQEQPESAAQPWTFSFSNWDPDHCYGSVVDLVADLDKSVAALLDLSPGLTHDDLRDQLHHHLEDTQERLQALDPSDVDERTRLGALETHITEASERLEPHSSCYCGSDSWDATGRDDADSCLADDTVRKATWVVYRQGTTPAGELAELTVSALFEKLECRDGWITVKLDWDPTTRTVSFSFDVYPSTWYGRAVALTHEQEELANQLQSLENYLEDAGALVLDTSDLAVTVTCELWGDAESGGPFAEAFDYDLEQAVHSVHDALKSLDDYAKTTARALAHGWTSDLDSLVATATTVAAA